VSESRQQRDALIGLGSNLGDRQATLVAAVKALRARAEISETVASSIYETAPVGVLDQPKFLNAVIVIRTSFLPEALLRALQEIEHSFGRERRERWGPRTLDLDLLAYEGEQRTTNELMLPHPRMFERAFVMVPLRELLTDGRYSRAGQWAELRERATETIASSGAIWSFAEPDAFES
jgi:2-amino-4-hydroxy-6-hydroxymethyldihydropteridine diphosphokinase